MLCWVLLLDAPRWGDSYEYIHKTIIFMINKKMSLIIIIIFSSFRDNFQGSQKGAIGVRITESLAYIVFPE